MKNKKVLNQEEIDLLSKSLGQRLAVFVSSLNLSDGAKELLINLLPSMSDEEILNLTNLLEEKYAQERDQISDLELENGLYQLLAKYSQQEEKIDQKTVQKMNNLFTK